jgi:hypothetical protein
VDEDELRREALQVWCQQAVEALAKPRGRARLGVRRQLRLDVPDGTSEACVLAGEDDVMTNSARGGQGDGDGRHLDRFGPGADD